MGNPLLDISGIVDQPFLDKYEVGASAAANPVAVDVHSLQLFYEIAACDGQPDSRRGEARPYVQGLQQLTIPCRCHHQS
jgi:hypothetical protein